MNAVAKSLGSQARGKWHEAKPHMTALHLRKSTGAMSIRPHLVQHAACAVESGYVTNSDLAGCGQTIVARWKFIGPRVGTVGERSRRMLKKARLLTRPTPAHQDAPLRGQGRSELRGEGVCFDTLSF
jgi:hypothetical protein